MSQSRTWRAGCCVPWLARCQLDHSEEWRNGGSTDLMNAALLCGWHNRFKSRGYRTWRDDDGVWHVVRPDGTVVTSAGTVGIGDTVTVKVRFKSYDLNLPFVPFIDDGWVESTAVSRVDYVPTQPDKACNA